MNERERDEPLSFGKPDEVARMLGEVQDVDPPADLVGTVMAKISSGDRRERVGSSPSNSAEAR